MKNKNLSDIRNKTVKELRMAGVKCKIFHSRYLRNGKLIPTFLINSGSEYTDLDPRGGVTTVFVNFNGEELVGEAVCSRRDSFSRKLGVKIALGRLQPLPKLTTQIQDNLVKELLSEPLFPESLPF